MNNLKTLQDKSILILKLSFSILMEFVQQIQIEIDNAAQVGNLLVFLL